MKFSKLCLGLAGLFCLSSATVAETEWPILDNGLNDVVQWDHYSYIINGQRLFIFSGEFHPWRIPVPEMWRELLQKVKAAGFNTFSIYISWASHSASADALDFTNGSHNFTSIMTIAKELGLFMMIRPGPYINAETNAGGFPPWLVTGEYGELRDDDDRYTAVWKPYWESLAAIVKPHLITNGGNVIIYQVENEYNGQWENVDKREVDTPIANYMQLLEDSARENGINIPLTHNGPNMESFSWSKDFSNATGNVDVVGLDSYPSCWSCNTSVCSGYVPYETQEYDAYFAIQSPRQPHFMPEFQGGSYNPWGGPEGGCAEDIGSDFANLFFRDLISQRITAVSLYMLYGGTNWGHSACPQLPTSYDYSSSVSENRTLWEKYYETKLLLLFIRAAEDLTHTNQIGNGTNYTTTTAITTTELQNPETDGKFYVFRHDDSTSSTVVRFNLTVDTSEGQFTIPRFGHYITINGHQGKIAVVDFTFGKKKLIYSTAEVLSYAVIDDKEILALWLPEGEAGEFSIKGSFKANILNNTGNTSIAVHKGDAETTISYIQNGDTNVIQLSDGTYILLLGREKAYHFWAPSLDSNPIVPANSTVFVQGPYLVRTATYEEEDHVLHLTGDSDEATTVTVFAPENLSSITWNGEKVNFKSYDGQFYTFSIAGPADFELPSLGSWKWTNGFPEIDSDYELSSNVWVVANRTKTYNTLVPASNNPVLYVDEYKIHHGNHIYRATFPSTSNPPTGVFLNITGGDAFGFSVWLNSDYLGSYYGFSYIGTQEQTFSFKNATLKDQGDNVLIVLMDQSGHDLVTSELVPRGIFNATLVGPGDDYNFTEWRIAGNAGFEDNIDPVRGPQNEGSLYPERVGMHLPGYPEDGWTELSSEATTLAVPSAGVRAFRIVVPLDVPEGVDVSISFQLTAPSNDKFTPSNPDYSNRLRALLFVNGYQYGRFSPYIGHQIDYPVPPGVLNYNGNNTILLTVWSQAAEGVEVKVELVANYVHSTGFDMLFDSAYLRPEWTEDRRKYA